MEFVKYQHVCRMGDVEVQGIENGECYIFPKIDGTNSSIFSLDDLQISYGSRNRHLYGDRDNQGFKAWAVQQENLLEFMTANPSLRLYGEWLVPHTLRTYRENAWNKFYIFDVMKDGIYLTYDEYSPLLEEYELDYIPPICKITNPTIEKLNELLESNMYLIKDGEGSGEGIVIKNYNYVNRYGRVTWGKIVKNEFKDKHMKSVREVQMKKNLENEIVMLYVTESLIEKEYAKIVADTDGWSTRHIARLLETVFYSLITEETWNFIKKFRNPIIDFKAMKTHTVMRIKELKPELF